MKTSKHINTQIKIKQLIAKIGKTQPRSIVKDVNSFVRIWPASIFENKRIAKLNGFIRFEISSIITNPNKIWKAIPVGKKLFKKSNFWILIASKVHPIKADIANKKVTDNVLVTLKTKGIKPKILVKKMKLNIVI